MFISVASTRSEKVETTQIHLSIARSQKSLEAAFRLTYESYVNAGLQEKNDLGMRLIPQHFLRETDVIVAKLGETTISTATLIADSDQGLPAESMCRDEIEAVRDRGLRVAEVGCLADRRGSAARFIEMFRWLSTLLAQAASTRGYDGLIAATHPRHARFYIRQLGFRKIGGIRECPYVQGNPAVPLLFDFEERRGSEIHDFLFRNKFSEAELAPYEWDRPTQDHFSSILNRLQLITGRNPQPPIVAPTLDLQPGLPSNPHVS
jgi:hypothetical protein